MTSSCWSCLGWDPRSGSVARWSWSWTSCPSMASETTVGLGNGTFWTTWHWDPRSGSVARFVQNSLAGQIMLEKRAFSTENQHFLMFFLTFFDFGRAWLMQSWSEPRKPRVEVDSGRWEKLRCHRIDELFKPNWPPETRK